MVVSPSSPHTARREHGVCRGSLWKQHMRGVEQKKSASADETSQKKTFEYVVLVGVTLTAFADCNAYRRGDYPMSLVRIVGASAWNHSSNADPSTSSSFRMVTFLGTHIVCEAPTPTDADLWLSALHAGLEASLALANAEPPLVLPPPSPKLSKEKQQSKPLRRGRSKQPVCMSCGLCQEGSSAALQSCPLPQYARETRCNVCPSCRVCQGLYLDIQRLSELYGMQEHEREALKTAREECWKVVATSDLQDVSIDEQQDEDFLVVPTGSAQTLLALINSASFGSYRRICPVLDRQCLLLEQGGSPTEFFDGLQTGQTKEEIQAGAYKKQAFRVAGDMGSAMKLLQDYALGNHDTDMLSYIIEFLLDLCEEGELSSVAFFWPQLRCIHLRMLPPENAQELTRVDMLEDFLLTVSTKYSVQLALELVWGHVADLEDSLYNPNCSPMIRKRRFSVLRFVCELESMLFDFDHGWGGGSVSLRNILSPSPHQVTLLRQAMISLQDHRLKLPSLTQSARMERLKHVKLTMPPEEAAQEALRIARNADYFSSHLSFTRRLCDIAERLRFMDVEMRAPTLQRELVSLNASGGMGGDPLNRAQEALVRVVRIPSREGHVFHSKERTPVLLLMEVFQEGVEEETLLEAKDDNILVDPQIANESAREQGGEDSTMESKALCIQAVRYAVDAELPEDESEKELDEAQSTSDVVKETQRDSTEEAGPGSAASEPKASESNIDGNVEIEDVSEGQEHMNENEASSEAIGESEPGENENDVTDSNEVEGNPEEVAESAVDTELPKEVSEKELDEAQSTSDVAKETQRNPTDEAGPGSAASEPKASESDLDGNGEIEDVSEGQEHMNEKEASSEAIGESEPGENENDVTDSSEIEGDPEEAAIITGSSVAIGDEAMNLEKDIAPTNSPAAEVDFSSSDVPPYHSPRALVNLRRFESPHSLQHQIPDSAPTKAAVKAMLNTALSHQLKLPTLDETQFDTSDKKSLTGDGEHDKPNSEETKEEIDSEESFSERSSVATSRFNRNSWQGGSRKMSAFGSSGEIGDSPGSIPSNEIRREVLTTIMTKGMKGSNAIAASAAAAAQRSLQDLDRKRAVDLILHGDDEPDPQKDASAFADDQQDDLEASRRKLREIGLDPASIDQSLEEDAAAFVPDEEDEAMEALRLLLLQNRAGQGILSPESAAQAMMQTSSLRNLTPRSPGLDSDGSIDRSEMIEIEAGDVDSRLVGCGALPPAVLSALTLWKGGVVTNGELLELVKKDLNFIRHSEVHAAKNTDKLIEDSKFWGRFAFGERWAEKKARIAASSPEGSLPGWDLVGIIIKSNDDLRQEAFVMQLIELCQEAFEMAGLDLWLYPYRILATGKTTGIIEMVRNAMSFDALKKRPGYGRGGLRGHLKRMTEFTADPAEAYRCAQQNFVRSLAAYSLLSYLFLFKDRHNGNILLDTAGHVIHIDFGFVFGVAPGGSFSLEMSTPFKLTEEMLDAMGGLESPLFFDFVTLFCCGFLTLQAHVDTFATIVESTCHGSNFKCFEGKGAEEVVSKMRERFVPQLNKEATVAYALDLIKQATTSFGTKQYDYFQYLSQGIAA